MNLALVDARPDCRGNFFPLLTLIGSSSSQVRSGLGLPARLGGTKIFHSSSRKKIFGVLTVNISIVMNSKVRPSTITTGGYVLVTMGALTVF